MPALAPSEPVWGSPEGWGLWKALQNNGSVREVWRIRKIPRLKKLFVGQNTEASIIHLFSAFQSEKRSPNPMLSSYGSFWSIRHELLQPVRGWQDGFILSCEKTVDRIIKIIIAGIMYGGHDFRWWVLIFILFLRYLLFIFTLNNSSRHSCFFLSPCLTCWGASHTVTKAGRGEQTLLQGTLHSLSWIGWLVNIKGLIFFLVHISNSNAVSYSIKSQ